MGNEKVTKHVIMVQFSGLEFLKKNQQTSAFPNNKISTEINSWRISVRKQQNSSRILNKGQQISLLPKNEQTNLFFYPDDSKRLETLISISSFKYFLVVRIEKQICLFIFLEKVWLDNFVSKSTELQSPLRAKMKS